MKTKLKFIIPALISIVLIVFAVWYISGWKSPSDIVSIKVSSEAPYFQVHYEYFIDFSENTLTYNDLKDDLKKITTFSDENKENFVHQASMYGFFNWKKSYLKNVSMNDSTMKDICITYSDGTEQEICFQQPNVPLTYEIMREVFNETFGYYII
ncbi:MAG: hypothetical protein K2J32_08865 [Ruminococcus sp.]|nr:hypothetical protein [Ruminococcus sp.]